MARLSDEEIEERRSALQGRDRHGDAIRRTFQLDDFKGSGDFVKPPDTRGGGDEPPP
jgi:pterin-4a-carbinolamine dehydratase